MKNVTYVIQTNLDCDKCGLYNIQWHDLAEHSDWSEKYTFPTVEQARLVIRETPEFFIRHNGVSYKIPKLNLRIIERIIDENAVEMAQ